MKTDTLSHNTGNLVFIMDKPMLTADTFVIFQGSSTSCNDKKQEVGHLCNLSDRSLPLSIVIHVFDLFLEKGIEV